MKVAAPSRHSLEAEVEAAAFTDILARCRAHDGAAWKELYDGSFDFVYRVARRLGTPEAEAEDVAHDVFLVVYRKLDDFEGGRLTTWLYRITANVVSDRHRRRRVREAFLSLRTWIGSEPVESPERDAEKKSAARAVERVLQRMSPKKREVFALYELEGLGGEEIAERVGCPVNTVWTRLFHARREFVAIALKLGVLDVAEAR
jgi:RNA polymerase sigma-70 factor, ECF subfamily